MIDFHKKGNSVKVMIKKSTCTSYSHSTCYQHHHLTLFLPALVWFSTWGREDMAIVMGVWVATDTAMAPDPAEARGMNNNPTTSMSERLSFTFWVT